MNSDTQGKTWCVVDEATNGGEYTVCGFAWTDSTMNVDGHEALSDPKPGKKATCVECKSIISWYKSL